MAKISIWFMETRPQFLLLPVVLAVLGTGVAVYEGVFDGFRAILAFVGLLLAHVAVNVLNDYFDYRSGLDTRTKQTPFSGGSGMLPEGKLRPGEALWFGLVSLFLAAGIGVFFLIDKGWLLLPIIVLAGFCIIFYSPVILKRSWPEWSPGLGLGVLPVLGIYFAQSGTYTFQAFAASVPAGLLVHNLLLLNEFPDVEADRTVGRKTLPITIGRKNAAIIHAVANVVVYLWIGGLVIFRLMPPFCLLSFITLPVAVKTSIGAFESASLDKLIPALGSNVLVVLLTQLLMGIGYMLSAVV